MKIQQGKIVERFSVNGKEIIFRYPKMSDVNGLMKYINGLIDEKAYIGAQKKLSRKEETAYVKNQLKGMRKGELIDIVVECDGKIIGNSNIWKSRIDAAKHVSELGIGLSKGWREMGIGTRLLKALMCMAKKELGAKIIRLSVYGDNARARHTYEKVGFRRVGCIPKGARRQSGRYYDEIIMVKL